MTPAAGPAVVAFLAEVGASMPNARVLTDLFSRVTQGADASPYRLVPAAVLLVETEIEIVAICRAATRHGVPITFRAAGTSLSGQAVSDSILVKLGHEGWRHFECTTSGAEVRLGPSLIGSQVNARLRAHGRKIGPDPASIDAAMIGGIIANNSSGMCCGTAQNSYQTLVSMRLVLADGTLVDTADPVSRTAFSTSHRALLDGLTALAAEVQADAALKALIQRKYAIKNTTGYSLNALVDFTDPFEILQHLIVGSEGTLGFVSSVTLNTVPEPPRKSAALVLFSDMQRACSAAARLRTEPVSAVEMMDYASLRSVVGQPGIPPGFANLAEGTAALLIDVRADDEPGLEASKAAVASALRTFAPLEPVAFSSDARTYANYWKVRKGLLPSVGGMRPTGTTVIVEDVAVPVESLARAATDLRDLLDRHGYRQGIVFGHALDGNLHFVFPQSFNSPEDIDRYARFTEDLTALIAVTHRGSLKAEHGTGRAMAPFVELEWGSRAYGLMRRIKSLFDPRGILNPGVILSSDPEIHLKALKPIPATDAVIDKCIECGFCEPVCPSRALTLTPRQRIVATRARTMIETDDADGAAFDRAYAYDSVDTCAGDGLCALRCPVGIDTGEMMRKQRTARHGSLARKAAGEVERHFAAVTAGARLALGAADAAHAVIGTGAMRSMTGAMGKVSRGLVPQWTPFLPTPARRGRQTAEAAGMTEVERPRVVLFTSCVNSVMGPARGAPDQRPLPEVMAGLLERADYAVTMANTAGKFCCGMPFRSKGFPEEAQRSADRLASEMRRLSRDGRDIIVSDTSPCSLTMRQSSPSEFRVLDLAKALEELVLPRIAVRRKAKSVALHVTCSTRKLGQEEQLLRLVAACADEVVVPSNIECCGFAGDKGFTTPELNQSALRHLAEQLPGSCSRGYSTSRTCEIGLSTHSGLHYQSVAYLLDWCSTEDPS